MARRHPALRTSGRCAGGEWRAYLISSPEWWNGRHAGLKIPCRQRRESSTLSSGIHQRQGGRGCGPFVVSQQSGSTTARRGAGPVVSNLATSSVVG